MSDVLRWTSGSVSASDVGGFVAYGDYLVLERENSNLRAQLAAREAECKNAWETGARHEALCHAEKIKAKDKEIEAMRPVVEAAQNCAYPSKGLAKALREYESKVSK